MDLKNFTETCQAYGVQGGKYRPGEVVQTLSPELFATLSAQALQSNAINDPTFDQTKDFVNIYSSGPLVCTAFKVPDPNGQLISQIGCYDVRSPMSTGGGPTIYCRRDGNMVACSSDQDTCSIQQIWSP